MEHCENTGNVCDQEVLSHPKNAKDDQLKAEYYPKNFPAEVKEYLAEISSDVSNSTNSKLRKEHQRLTDLLASYKRLTERLAKEAELNSLGIGSNFISDTRTNVSSARRNGTKEIVPVLPEIYAALRPDLYRDVREEEKKRLITKFSKRRLYSPVEKIIPPYTSPRSHTVQNRRENEKDRFCSLMSTANSRFHNPIGNVSPKPPKSRLNRDIRLCKVEDVREKEKERLAKIFSNAVVLTKSVRKPVKSPKISDNLIQDRSQLSQRNMVRMGEYSPLNGQNRGKTTLGVGEHEEQQKQLTIERKQEYIDSVAYRRAVKEQQETIDNHNRSETNSRRLRTSTASTQTDSEESSTSFQDNEVDSVVPSASSSPRRRIAFEYSPREKLLSDLYGCPPMNHAAHNEREKQAAYAEALRAQIEEKKRLVDERKRKEKEEEELIEKRVREQAERLKMEYQKEQKKKMSWMQQSQAQEEALRKRLKELELESFELKTLERQKKLQKIDEVEQNGKGSYSKRLLQKRHSLNLNLSPDSSFATNHLSGNKTHTRETFTMPTMLEVAPLLESDKQNILSYKSDELRRDHGGNEIFSLGPGVNLLSPRHIDNTGRTGEPYSCDGPRNVSAVDYQEPSRLPSQSADSPHLPHRPPSPIVPALQTDMIIKNSPKVLENKWTHNGQPPKDTPPIKTDKETYETKNILTQLGEFRRKLAMEHQLLEERLKLNNS